jgi:hypothetical protein
MLRAAADADGATHAAGADGAAPATSSRIQGIGGLKYWAKDVRGWFLDLGGFGADGGVGAGHDGAGLLLEFGAPVLWRWL